MKPKSAVSADWAALNKQLRTANESLCCKLLKIEQLGKQRVQFLRRIHSRLNRVRAARERKELVKPV